MPLIAAAFFAVPAAATATGPLVLGTRDGLEVVLFPEPRPHVLQVLPAVVVVLRPGTPVPAELAARAKRLGRDTWRLPAPHPVEAAARWTAHPDVLAADPDALRPHRGADFDDPHYGGQWYLEKLKMDPLFEVSLGSPDVRVAVIDSSTEIAHPDLAPAVDAPFDAVDDDADPSPIPGEFCPRGVVDLCDTHGTGVSGIIAARANNGVGIVGLCPQCTLIPIRLISEGNTPLSADVRAFEHAIEQDAAVINNSWGFTEATPVPRSLAAVIRRAATEPRGGLGAVVVFAAGNDDRDLLDDEVTGLEDVLCVSAADSYGRPTAYTNRGPSVDVCAPSATVTLAPNGGVQETFGGTSAAAPVVSGLAAWVLSVAPELSAAEVRALLVETAAQSPLITPDADGHHPVYGYGIVSPTALLARLAPPVPDAGLPDAGPDEADAQAATLDASPTETDATGGSPDPAPVPSSEDATGSAGPDAANASGANGGGGGGCVAVAPGGVSPAGAVVSLLAALGLITRRRAARTHSRSRG
jgi:serine protease